MQDEISIQDIVVRLWLRRGMIVSIVVLAALGTGAWSLLSIAYGAQELVYFIDLKGIEKGKYPGGAAFSPNDLQSPEVLRASLEAARIDAESLDEITDGLLIEYGAPETIGIMKKYRERLSAENLSAAEIDARNKEFRDELAAATGSSLRLMLSPEVAGLGTASAHRLLQEIPAQWSRIYSERYRIYDAPGLEGAAVTLNVESLSDPSSAIAAVRILGTVANGLETIAHDNRISHLVSKSGNSAAELLERLHVYQSTQFGPMSLAVLGRPDPVTDSHRADLRFRIQYLTEQIESYNRIAGDIIRGQEGAAGEWSDRSDGSAVNQLQLSGDSLGTIIDLTERASSAEFLREVMLNRHELATDLAKAKVELGRLEIPSQYQPEAETVAAVEAEFMALTAEYEDLYAVALERLRTDLGTLYSVAATPVRLGSFDLQSVGMRILGVVLGAAFLSFFAAFLLPDPRAIRAGANRRRKDLAA